MQALALCDLRLNAAILGALSELEDPPDGMVRARVHFLNGKTYAKFMWADWPKDLSETLKERVGRFLAQHLDLRPLEESAEDWWAIFAGEPDGEAAAEIGKRLLAHFPARVHWVVAERTGRGKIVAWSLIDEVGEILWHLSWRHVGAEPTVTANPAISRLSNQDVQKLNAAILDVYRWAECRVKPILDALCDKLSTLYGGRFRGLYVYGSYARPDAGIKLSEDSDLDVALILSDFASVHEERERFGDIVYDLSLEHGLAISVVPVREAEYRNQTSSFTREISSYAVPAR
ncbi:MAG TPA: nucleotidyltransferase domain-containing protein [Terriglobia bacterium]